MIYELINPSDRITFRAPDTRTAALVCFVLGQGRYAADPMPEAGEDAAGFEKVPLFLFGGAEAWWSERWPDEPLDQAGERHAATLVPALRTVCLGDRRMFDLALEAIDDPARREAFIASWNDRSRSSLNDIMGRAHRLADALAARHPEGDPAP